MLELTVHWADFLDLWGVYEMSNFRSAIYRIGLPDLIPTSSYRISTSLLTFDWRTDDDSGSSHFAVRTGRFPSFTMPSVCWWRLALYGIIRYTVACIYLRKVYWRSISGSMRMYDQNEARGGLQAVRERSIRIDQLMVHSCSPCAESGYGIPVTQQSCIGKWLMVLPSPRD